VILFGEHRLRVVQPLRRVRPVHTVGQALYEGGHVRLYRNDDLAGYRPLGRHRLRAAQPHDTRGFRRVLLPAAERDGIPLAHQKAIARVDGIVRRDIRGTVEIAKGQGTTSVDDIEEQAVIAPLRLHGFDETIIGRKMHLTMQIAWGQM
jgi:hypothetical protein